MKTKMRQLAILLGDVELQRIALRTGLALTCAAMLCQMATPVLAAPHPDPISGLAKLVKAAVNLLIILTGLGMVFTIAFTGATATIAKMAGAPYAEANATLKIIGVVVCFCLTAFSIPLANAIIDNIMADGSYTSEDIHVPKP
jgi:Na+/phosphate symporter